MKKIKGISIYLIICLLAALLSFPVYAEESGEAEIYTENTITAKAAERVSVPVYLKNDPGIMGYVLQFDYDAAVLQPVAVLQGDAIGEGNFNDDIEGTTSKEGSFRVMWNHAANVTADGQLFTIEFTVADQAYGPTSIAVSYDAEDTYNEQYENVTLLCNDINLDITHDHVAGEPAEENRVEPTVETEGSYEEVLHCVLCGEELSRTKVAIDKLPDKTGLETCIKEALDNLSKTKQSVDGTDVDPAEHWVTEADAAIFMTVIKNAMLVFADQNTSNAALEAILAQMQTAAETFDRSKKEGLLTDKTELQATVAMAQEILAATRISADGTDVYPSEQWVTEAESNAFAEKIEMALETLTSVDATQEDVNDAAAALASYQKDLFEVQRKTGTLVTDKGELKSALDAAAQLIDHVKISEDGSDILSSDLWIPKEKLAAYLKAVSAAEAAYQDAEIKEADVADAVSKLKAAQKVFEKSRKAGTAVVMTIDKSGLAAALEESMDDVMDTTISVDGTDVPVGRKWVDVNAADNFTRVIADAVSALSAERVSQKEINEVTDRLTNARSAYEKAKKPGTKKDPISLNGAKITLNQTSLIYTGKALTVQVKVMNGSTVLRPDVDYTLAFSGNQNVGTAKVTIQGQNEYTGTVTKTFRIVPKGASISKLTAVKKGMQIKWKKQAKQTTGYQIQYSTNSKFKSGNKTVTVKGAKKTSKKITKLKSGKKYYVRIRTYRKVGGKTYYSTWSKAKSVKVK